MSKVESGKWCRLYKDSTTSFHSISEAQAAPIFDAEPDVPLSIRLFAVVSKDELHKAIAGKPIQDVVWMSQDHAKAALDKLDKPDLFLANAWLTVSELKINSSETDLEVAVEASEGVNHLISLKTIEVLSPHGHWLQRNCSSPMAGFAYGR